MKEGRKRDRKAASEQDVETQPTRKKPADEGGQDKEDRKRTHLSKSPDLGIVKPREKKEDDAESSLKLSFTERLRNLGFRIVTIDGDGNCLFRAILHQIHGDDKDHATLRTNVVGYMERHPERFDEECRDSSLSYHAYCESMKRDKICGGFAELAAAAQVTRSRIRLYYDDSENYTDIEPFAGYVAERTIFLSYHGRIHFNSLAKIIEGETSPDSGMGIAREKKEAETEGLPDSGMEIAREVHISNRPNIVWWDHENIEVPTELDHSLARYRIIKKMRDSGFRGPVKFKVVVGYLDSNVPKMKNIEIMHANECIRPTRNTKGNQAADLFLRGKIKSWVVENPQPHNVFFFSGDHGFDKVLPLFAGHRLILVLQESQGVENASVDLIWNWRNCLGVPSRVYKNPNAQKEAERKRARSKAHLKAKTKKSKQDRAAAVAKAQDENVPIPKSISQDGTRVQIVIYLEIHIQEPAIISVENDHIHVAAPQAGRVLELIARRVGKPMKEITVQNVGDSKWIVQVENIAARDVFWKLVKAASY